jgi:pSer/pThr/pTyr-binding forkhead associated (FHA) protein
MGAFIEDLGSQHGTFLNGKQITGLTPLVRPNDKITLGGPTASETVPQLQYTKKAADAEVTRR